jgi:hypothetical protein
MEERGVENQTIFYPPKRRFSSCHTALHHLRLQRVGGLLKIFDWTSLMRVILT